MTSKLEDEDYWNSSESKAFSFDEEEVSNTLIVMLFKLCNRVM